MEFVRGRGRHIQTETARDREIHIDTHRERERERHIHTQRDTDTRRDNTEVHRETEERRRDGEGVKLGLLRGRL